MEGYFIMLLNRLILVIAAKNQHGRRPGGHANENLRVGLNLDLSDFH